MKHFLGAIILAMAPLAVAAEHEIAALTDPPNDDFGAGTLVYPERGDYAKGDLDLRKLTIRTDGKGYWFTATFANPIRDPKNARTGVGPEPMPVTARYGFYSFNLDIYIDTDRTPGSGNTFTLPGRKARIDPAYAWERAVVLTPRPELARSELFDVLSRQFPDRSQSEAQASVNQAVYFPTEVRVHGKSIEFYVPGSFIGASDGSDWAVTAFVTGAKPYSALSLGLFPTSKTPLDQLDMGAMQPGPGRPEYTFGYETAAGASPIVDALMPTVAQQIALVGNDEPLIGMSWGARAANEDAQARRYEGGARNVAEKPRAPAAPESSSFSLYGLKGLFQSGTKAPESKNARRGGKPAPVSSFLDPGAKAGPQGLPPSQQKSVEERLRILQQLYDDKLINEEEYRLHKQRILGDL